MPSKHALNVSLTEQLRVFVEEEVRSGRFQTASEVVRAALRLLQASAASEPKRGPNGNARAAPP